MTIERLLLPPLLILAVILIDETQRENKIHIDRKYRHSLILHLEKHSKNHWKYEKYRGSLRRTIFDYINPNGYSDLRLRLRP